jgi:hypothetical protein
MTEREEIDWLRALVKKHAKDVEKLSHFLFIHFKRDIDEYHKKNPEADSPCEFAIEILKKAIL